ncbi:glycosyl transferase family 2 [Stenotrophomonas terrae]|uniref:Glycosyl transferase family 2 n=1 Tax=Stenotrophomonas terrae TaxID=405446 RepID=A0A0R0CLU8_9GAMM|nr:glycosyltransferase family A protein [Stenotrophomonas terrae]KRG65832.1 glycosyl transferase family 2 [Stenotrophomonas terrae]
MTTFAVVITNYNYASFVCEAVDSVLAQTRAATQILVVDDGSSDGSPELLRHHYGNDSRVSLLFGENEGQLAAFQRGVAAAHTDVICFLDADDRWKPGYLQQIGALYDARRDVDFVFSDLQTFGIDSLDIRYEDSQQPIDLGYTAISTYFLLPWYGAPTSALSLRRSWAVDVLDLPHSLRRQWKLCADACVVHGASILGARKYYLPTACVEYRIHGNNGWWASHREPTSRYRNSLRDYGIVRMYAARNGLDEACCSLGKREYRTKPEPSGKERRRYVRIALRGTAPWWERYEQAISILFGRRSRRR